MIRDEERRRLRRDLRARLSRMTATERARAQRRAIARLARLACYRCARHVGLYHAVGTEIDPAALAPAPDKHFYLPVVTGRRLRFAALGGRLARNRFGIPEPVRSRRVPPGTLDLVVVPLTGFDAAGNRLGTGGGYYDRSFAYRLVRPHAGPPRLVGLAFACQRVDRLPVASWDVPLDLVVTETGVHRPRRDAG